jgi:multidrug efflux pump subunit AcrB
VHEKIRANYDRIPVGIPEPLIVGRGINDVAIVVLTLSPKPEATARWTDKDLYELADKLRAELMKVDNVGLTYISGGNPQQIRSSLTQKSLRSTASRCNNSSGK